MIIQAANNEQWSLAPEQTELIHCKYQIININ